MSGQDDTTDFWRCAAALARSHGAHVLMTGGESEAVAAREVDAILALLPPLRREDRVLEPAAGVGRFTPALAARAGRIDAWDIVPEFVEENRRRCAGLPNVHLEVADARHLDFPTDQTVGLVFVNWLLMYLSDDEAAALLECLLRTLRPGGHLFLRESCDPAKAAADVTRPWSGEWLGATYRVYYRPSAYYHDQLVRLAGARLMALAEHDLDRLDEASEPSGQRAWILTLG